MYVSQQYETWYFYEVIHTDDINFEFGLIKYRQTSGTSQNPEGILEGWEVINCREYDIILVSEYVTYIRNKRINICLG